MKFGAPTSTFSEEDFVSRDMIIQLGVEPCRIDLLTGIDGVEFDAAWENRITITMDDMELDVLSRADLLQNKLAANRDKDKSDIAWLAKK
jgi:hypothetical protein